MAHIHRLNCDYAFTKITENLGCHNYQLQPQENQVSSNEKQLEISWKNKPWKTEAAAAALEAAQRLIHYCTHTPAYMVYVCVYVLSRNRNRGENYVNGKKCLEIAVYSLLNICKRFGMCKSDRLQTRGSDWQQQRQQVGDKCVSVKKTSARTYIFLHHNRSENTYLIEFVCMAVAVAVDNRDNMSGFANQRMSKLICCACCKCHSSVQMLVSELPHICDEYEYMHLWVRLVPKMNMMCSWRQHVLKHPQICIRRVFQSPINEFLLVAKNAAAT